MAFKKANTKIEISPPNFKSVTLRVVGASPLMLHRFSEKARKQIEEKQTATNKTKAKREPKDYKAEYEAARYTSASGWEGVPAGAFRAAMIAACRTIDGLPMTKAKGAFVVKADGRDKDDGTSLIRIRGKSVHDKRPVRLADGGTDIRNRPRYDDWEANVTIEFDADMLSANDVGALLARAGLQVGIGELRPQAPNSFGGDYGMFTVTTAKALKAVA